MKKICCCLCLIVQILFAVDSIRYVSADQQGSGHQLIDQETIVDGDTEYNNQNDIPSQNNESDDNIISQESNDPITLSDHGSSDPDNDIPDIFISEIYRDDSDERVEITNAGSETFSGQITLSGLKNILLHRFVTIQPGQQIILCDQCQQLIDMQSVVFSDMAFVISDVQPFHAQLLIQDQLVDEVMIDQHTMKQYNNTKTSFFKTTKFDFLSPTAETQTFNVWCPFRATPGSLTGTGPCQQKNIQTAQTPHILITEVFFEGRTERIELTNVGPTDFLGSVTIKGAANNSLHISDLSLNAGQSIIIADNASNVVDTGVIYSQLYTMILKDDGDIALSLEREGHVIDTFNVDKALVAPYLNAKKSFERVKQGSQYIITIANPQRNYNIADGFVGNPGIVATIPTQDVVIDIEQHDHGDSDEHQDLVEDPLGHDQPDIDSCHTGSLPIMISEIYAGGGRFDRYVEFFFFDDRSGMVVLSGGGQVSFFLSGQKNTYALISVSTKGFIAGENILIEPQLTTLSDDKWTLLGQSGQVLDRVTQIVYIDQKSVYNTISTDCGRPMSTSGQPSPGFDYRYLDYLVVQQSTVVQSSSSSSFLGSCPATMSTVGSGDLLDQQGYTGTMASGSVLSGNDIILSGDKEIGFTFIEHTKNNRYNSEALGLVMNNQGQLDLKGFYLLINGKKRNLTGILTGGQERVITGNFGFPDTKDACVELKYGEILYDTICYTISQKTLLQSSTGSVATSGSQHSIENISLTLSFIEHTKNNRYNSEALGLVMNNQGQLDLKGFYLLINGKKRNLTGILTGGQERVITGNFGFPDTVDSCVELRDARILYDTICYTIPQKSTSQQKTDALKTGATQITIPDVLLQFTFIEYTKNNRYNSEAFGVIMNNQGQLDLKGFYLLINGRKRNLTGTLVGGQERLFVGNFGFPDTKDTCVELKYGEILYDTICYTISPKTLKTASGSIKEDLMPQALVKITHLLPDPEGVDTDKEEIGFTLFDPQMVSLSGWVVRGGSKRIILSGMLTKHRQVIMRGTFGFHNKQACIDLIDAQKVVVDRYCYQDAQTNEVFDLTGSTIRSLKGSKTTTRKKRLTSSYQDELRLYKAYVSTLHAYLREDWSLMYNKTDLVFYRKAFDEAIKQLKQRRYVIMIDGAWLDVYNLPGYAYMLKQQFLSFKIPFFSSSIKNTIDNFQSVYYKNLYGDALSFVLRD